MTRFPSPAAIFCVVQAVCAAAASAAPASAPSAAASQAHTATPAKQALIQQVVQLQQPAIDGMAHQLAEQPAARLMQQAGAAVQQRVPPEKREAVAKDIQSDVKKYIDEVYPLLRTKATAIAPATIGPILDDKLSEADLKQLVGMLQSPAYRKYQQIGVQMQQALGEKLVTEERSTIEAKMQTLQQALVKRIGADAPAPAASGGAVK